MTFHSDGEFVHIHRTAIGRMASIRPIATAVLLQLVVRAGRYDAEPSRLTVAAGKREIAEWLKISKATAIGAVRDLEEHGFLKVVKPGTRAGGATVYEIL